jgi:hypothetical protein
MLPDGSLRDPPIPTSARKVGRERRRWYVPPEACTCWLDDFEHAWGETNTSAAGPPRCFPHLAPRPDMHTRSPPPSAMGWPPPSLEEAAPDPIHLRAICGDDTTEGILSSHPPRSPWENVLWFRGISRQFLLVIYLVYFWFVLPPIHKKVLGFSSIQP